MTRAAKAPAWREQEVGDTWHPCTVWRARLQGWTLDVCETTRGRREPTGMWFVTAEHRDGRVFNSAWAEINKGWRGRELAQAAAVRGAREGWEFLKASPTPS